MSPPPFRSPIRPRARGFSLVEVVLAVGIISFCLVALIGLLATSMNASRESTTATADTLLFQKIINQLRVASLDPDQRQTGSTASDNRFPLPATGEVDNLTFTVDELNRYIADGAAGSHPRASRVVTINVLNPEEFNSKRPVNLGSGGELSAVSVTIKPAQGSTRNNEAFTFATELYLDTL